MIFARPPSANAKRKVERCNFCDKNYNDTVILPVYYFPVKLIVIKFKIDFESDVHHTFGNDVY